MDDGEEEQQQEQQLFCENCESLGHDTEHCDKFDEVGVKWKKERGERTDFIIIRCIEIFILSNKTIPYFLIHSAGTPSPSIIESRWLKVFSSAMGLRELRREEREFDA